jgi:predicted SnoaL-like aldol condensation-catalyzing enzyme
VRALRFIDLWNAGRVRDALANAAPSYTYQDATMGPLDKDAHIAMMEGILERIPDRRIRVAREWSVGDVEFVEYVWSGTTGADPIQSDWLAIFEFDGQTLQRQRHYRGT